MTLPRRALLALPLLAAGCAVEAPVRENFPPLHYDYLLKLRLNVADIELAPPPPPGPLDSLDPAPPAQALLEMARDRLVASGSLGRAVFVIDNATISKIPDGLDGALGVHLDILTAEGTRAGFAEAKVSRRLVGIGGDLRAALYDITKQMMQDMNVEFEFQIRRTLRDYLQVTSTAPLPAPVQQQPLSP
jgi:hypothetical protein